MPVPDSERSHKRFRTARLIQYALKSKQALLMGFVLTAVAVAADLLGTYIIGRLIDGHIRVGQTNLTILVQMAGVFFLSVLIAAAMRYLSALFFHKAANRLTVDMQRDVFNHVQKLPIAFFDQLPAGKVVSRITNDAKAVRVLFQVVLVQLATALIYMLGIYIMLLILDATLFWLMAAPLPIIGWLVYDFRKKSAVYNRDYRKALSELNGNLNENIQGMDIIQATRKETETFERFSAINKDVFEHGFKMTKLFAYSVFNATTTLQYVLLALVMLYFGYGHLAGAWLVPIGNIYIFLDYMNRFYGQVSHGMTRIGELERALGAADHMFELMREPEAALRPNTGLTLQGGVRFDHITFAYLDEPVLKDVSFAAAPGQTVAFVGHTGSGKSTIMNLIFDFYEAQAGTIYFDNRPLSELGQDDIRSQMAIVLQDPFLFAGTLYTNVTLGDTRFSKEDAVQALLDVGGRPFLNRLKDGIDTPVREKGSEFSQGERQLVSFARALLRNPKILVLDEATASIDSETEQAISAGIRRLEIGRTTLIIAHRLSTIRHADMIYVLEQGQIRESGTHDELIASRGIYREMFEAQSKEAS